VGIKSFSKLGCLDVKIPNLALLFVFQLHNETL
jgi:hypothetical protein